MVLLNDLNKLGLFFLLFLANSAADFANGHFYETLQHVEEKKGQCPLTR